MVLVGAAGILFAAGNWIVPVAQPLLILLLGWAGVSVRQAVENAHKRAEIQRARQIAEHELDIGRKIQSGFLPADLPAPKGWQIAAHFQPALQVSGDFYDVFEMAGGRYTGIVMADVCDHGVGSALFMALTRSLLRAYALQDTAKMEAAPEDFQAWSESVAVDAIRQTNEYIAGTHGEASMFATLFFGILVMLTPLFHGVGPHHFNKEYTWPYKGIIAGFDPVAVDSVGLQIIQSRRREYFGEDKPLNPPAKHILLADTRHHLGTADPEMIELVKLGWKEGAMV